MASVQLSFRLSSADCDHQITLDDEDIVNGDELFERYMKYKLFVLLDHGYVIAAAFADTEQDAIDEIADSGKLSNFRVEPEDEKGSEYYTSCGNDGSMYDLDCVSIYSYAIDYDKLSVCANLAHLKDNGGLS